MVELYFGLPGCGKSTLLAKKAYDALHGNTYRNVYANVDLNLDGYIRIYKDDLMHYDIHDGLVLIDEAALEFNARKYKSFSDNLLYFFRLSRHLRVDICLMSQGWDDIDKSIRTITDRVYYVYKNKIFFRNMTKYYRIPYGIIIPDSKKGQDKLGEIIQGYSKPSILLRIFCSRFNRKRYYRYFDSFERPELPTLPQDRLRITTNVPDGNLLPGSDLARRFYSKDI